jgi:ribosome biogenesis GTPase
MSDRKLTGLVIKSQSGFFIVRTDNGDYTCQIPKRLKYEILQRQRTEDEKYTDIVAVGDRVTFEPTNSETGQIVAVAERDRVLARTRPAPTARNTLLDREQVLVANPDQVVFVFSIKDPEPSLRKLDRLLVITERQDIPTVICVNKTDLVAPGAAQALFHVYEEIGYPVIYTSVETGEGIDALREQLRGKLSALAGSSGVGKSSLLNTVQPELGIKIGAVSEATTKGKHTTRHTELIPLDVGGYVADTPGIRGIALFDLEAGELDGYFREIAPLVADCQFSDCTHTHEDNCAVLTALAAGRISAERYDSYLRLREEHEDLHDSAY